MKACKKSECCILRDRFQVCGDHKNSSCNNFLNAGGFRTFNRSNQWGSSRTLSLPFSSTYISSLLNEAIRLPKACCHRIVIMSFFTVFKERSFRNIWRYVGMVQVTDLISFWAKSRVRSISLVLLIMCGISDMIWSFIQSINNNCLHDSLRDMLEHCKHTSNNKSLTLVGYDGFSMSVIDVQLQW